MVLPIAESHQAYAEKLLARLKENGVRAEVDASSNTLNYRIRNAQTQKIPYMLVLGDREVEKDAMAVRVRNGEDLGALSFDAFIELFEQKVADKAKE